MADGPDRAVLADTLAACRTGFLALCVFSLGINLLTLVVPLYLLQIIDRVIPNRSTETLIVLTVVFVIGLVTLASLEAIRQFVLLRIGRWVEGRLGGEVLASSIVRSVRKSRRPSVQALRDLSTLRQFMTGPNVLPILDAPFVPIVIAVIFLLHPVIGSVTLGGAAILLTIALINERTTRPLGDAAGEAASRAQDDAHAVTRNADVIEAMGMRTDVVRRWSWANAKALDLQALEAQRNGQLAAIAKFVRMGLQITVMCVAALLVIDNQMTIGAMIACVLLMRRAVAPVERAIGTWKMVVSARGAYKRVKQRLERYKTVGSHTPIAELTGHLKVRSLSYSPSASRSSSVLRRVTFELEPGEVLGLVGPTAAGKTTLARLLLGNLKPSSGYVRLDSVDVTRWDREVLGPQVGFLPQTVELLAGTVRQNIARMGDGDPDSVVAAAELAGVHELICRLPNGYETEIGEDGSTLSGGQKQRIGLARAVYGNPRFLVLDEPDASLDREGQEALTETIVRLKQRGATIVLITHRPVLLKHTDKILMLRRGDAELSITDDELRLEEDPVRKLQLEYSSRRGQGDRHA